MSSNRTWVTQCFLPASVNLLSREVDWLHSGESGAKDKDLDWVYNDELGCNPEKLSENDGVMNYFVHDRHNFMARGGELLFLQLVNLFDNIQSEDIKTFSEIPSYYHLKAFIGNIRKDVEDGLSALLTSGSGSLNNAIDFVSDALHGYDINPNHATLGWIQLQVKLKPCYLQWKLETYVRLI